MAIVSDGFFMHVDLVDTGGNKSTKKYKLVAADFATAQAAATSILAGLAGVTEALVKSYRLGEALVEDAAVYGSGEIENIGQVVAKLETAPKTVNIEIPAPLPALFVGASGPDYNVLDPANVALQTYIALWEASGVASLSDGEFVRDSATAGNFSGKRTHRGSKKG